MTGASLYGGFAGTESARDQRNIDANPTILSGASTVDGANENSFHVVTGADGATLDGFTITQGSAHTFVDENEYGGGMYNRSASPTVTNCTFTSNTAAYGGGIANLNASPTVTNCSFIGNVAHYAGGGMENAESSALTVTNCIFESNSAASGGAINSDNSSPNISNCTITNNSAGSSGGGIANSGSTSIISQCQFSNNRASYGGGMANFSGSSVISDCVFSGNTASRGIVLRGAGFEILGHGGGMANENESTDAIVNCVFVGNTSTDYGGGIEIQDSSPWVSNCTLANNSAAIEGGGLYANQSPAARITNSIFWSDTVNGAVSEIAADPGSDAPAVSYSIVQGGYSSAAGVIDGDPLFVNLAAGDLHLSAGSPAIDAGDGCAIHVPLTDTDGKGRWDITNIPNGSTALDIGAFEYQGTPGIDDPIGTGCETVP